jgi:hypothetical protein
MPDCKWSEKIDVFLACSVSSKARKEQDLPHVLEPARKIPAV